MVASLPRTGTTDFARLALAKQYVEDDVSSGLLKETIDQAHLSLKIRLVDEGKLNGAGIEIVLGEYDRLLAEMRATLYEKVVSAVYDSYTTDELHTLIQFRREHPTLHRKAQEIMLAQSQLVAESQIKIEEGLNTVYQKAMAFRRNRYY